ncbi:putative RNA-directed DNA polymerase, eukaryota, reverse transcriptase zinc-binding domain protein [Tanacetum coccineum]
MENKKRKSKQKKKNLEVRTTSAQQPRADNKRSWVKDLIESESLIFFGIQETKIDVVDSPLIRSLWPRSFIDFAFCSSHGAPGVAQSPSLKDQLWSDMENLINAIDVVWIIFGDFNVVRCHDERFGCLFDISEANSFNDFISRVGLFDFPLGGRRFTRFDKNGSKASKLDRFLVSGNFLDYWTDASVSLLCRSISDHCPLLLKVGSLNFGPKPYRIFDKWIGNEEFKGVITNSWASSQPPLSADLVLKNKLKKLRLDIKTWTTNQMLSQNKVKEDLKKQLLEWDVRAENGLINDLDVAKREEWIMDLNHLDQIHRNDLKQKSRIRWAVEGDENTRTLNQDERVYKRVLTPPTPRTRMLQPVYSTQSQIQSFKDFPSIKKASISNMGSKAPGPDGFNFNFVKTYWNTIKSDFWDCIINFESSGHIANGCNPSFIVLIPKKLDSLGFSDYRPISLIGCVYKVISKILANKLAKVIPSIINPNQSAFIAGRKILDGCLIANEIIRMASIENLQLLIFKVDFVKAFDSVIWNFLFDIMRQMGFSSKWRKWMFSCLSSASISVIVNGSPTKEFRSERGIRQGDPLSPFLFLIVAEALQVTILEACEKGVYSGLRLVESGSNLSLLQYADECDGSLLAKNMAFLGKWKWRFLVEKNALWRTVIKDFYGIDGGFGSPYNSFGLGGIWCDIIKLVADISHTDPSVNNSFVLKVSNGCGTSFWADPWCPNGLNLKDALPRIFALETLKDCKEADRWKCSNGTWGGNWSWRLPPRGRAIDDLSSLECLIGDLILHSDGDDNWGWKGDASRIFKVKTL